jgi:hypothetical protein
MPSDASFSILTITELIQTLRPLITLPMVLKRSKRALLDAIPRMSAEIHYVLTQAVAAKIAQRVLPLTDNNNPDQVCVYVIY